jgi:decaprenyl-phosphate phosphoribosyltransferase
MLRPADVVVRSPGRPLRRWSAILTLLRPGQWTKNLLCLAAPAAAGALTSPGPLIRAGTGAAAFALAAGAVYAANDVADAEGDREHPAKRLRPVASGAVSPSAALATSAVCGGAGLLVAATLGWLTLTVVTLYLVSSAAYVLRLRRVPVLDVVTVALGFVLRALAGAAATHLAVSSWFLLVALFGSLFLVCAKRRAELSRPSLANTAGRASLREYSVGWLDQVLTLSLSGTVLAYAMWAFQPQDAAVTRSVLAVSVLPVLVALLRYLLLVDHGSGERPEHAIIDPIVLGCSVLWCTLLAAGLYLV